ncbi:hypothetical protein C2E23DRAFT_578926 [Lenzites betulinus]|nr:hypothetical protein C2E23DRAFT_578926 [Lenzites betulinus]
MRHIYRGASAIIAFARDKFGISTHRRHREATNLMLAASRVCKTWAPLATEFLFKYLVIKSGDHAISIAAAMELYEKNRPTYRPAGHWTVRLELALEGVHRWHNPHSAALERILACCPNITVFSTAFCAADPLLSQTPCFRRTIHAIAIRTNLKRVEVNNDVAKLETALRYVTPSVETLWLSGLEAGPTFSRPVHLPLVHTLILSEGFARDDLPDTWTAPTLKTLWIGDNGFAGPKPSVVEAFFHLHGSQLKNYVTGGSNFGLVHLCPNLVECTLICVALGQLSRGAPLPTTIRYLTVVDDKSSIPIFPLDTLALLIDWLERAPLPALETIRFIVPFSGLPRSLRLHEDFEWAFRMLCERCQQLGVRVETSSGQDNHTADRWKTFTVDHVNPG